MSGGETRRVHGPNLIKISNSQKIETTCGGLNPGHSRQPYKNLHAGAKAPGSLDAAGWRTLTDVLSASNPRRANAASAAGLAAALAAAIAGRGGREPPV